MGRKSEHTLHQRRQNERQINTWRRSEKCRLRPQWEGTTHPPKWLRWVRLAKPSIGEDVQQLKWLLMGVWNVTATLETAGQFLIKLNLHL